MFVLRYHRRDARAVERVIGPVIARAEVDVTRRLTPKWFELRGDDRRLMTRLRKHTRAWVQEAWLLDAGPKSDSRRS